MTRARLFLVLSAALLAGIAATAAAEVWTVTLENGTTFETRYRPEPAPWDSSITLVTTGRGNQIGLMTSDIVDVISASEASGFGYRLDTTTLFLGWSPNDLVSVDEDGNETSAYEAPALPPQDAYSVRQFIDVPVMGQAAPATAIPVSETLSGGGDGN